VSLKRFFSVVDTVLAGLQLVDTAYTAIRRLVKGKPKPVERPRPPPVRLRSLDEITRLRGAQTVALPRRKPDNDAS
jgi:hypothetical protein